MAIGLGKRFRTVCLLLLVLLIGVGAMVYQSTVQLMAMNRLIEHSQVILVQLAAAQASLDESISRTRAYLVAGNQSDFDRAVKAKTETADTLQSIRLLTADSVAEQQWLNELAAELQQTYGYWDQAVHLRKTGDVDGGDHLMSSPEPQRLIREDREIIADMVEQENELLGFRSTQASASARRGLFVELFLAFAVLATLLWAYLFVTMDMNEKGKALRAQQESEERLRLLLESTAEAIHGIDKDTNCTFCNPAFLNMFGFRDASDVIGKKVHALIHHTRPDGAPYRLEECPSYHVLRTGLGVHVDNELLWRTNGTSFPAEYWTHAIRNGGQVIGAVTALVDISERKLAETKLGEVHEQLNVALRESEARARENVELSNLGDLFQSCRTMEEACKISASILPRIFPHRAGALCLTTPSRNIVETVATWNDCSSCEAVFPPEDCWALRRGKAHDMTDSSSPMRCAHVSADARGYLCVPLAAEGETLGVLYIADAPASGEAGVQPENLDRENLKRLAAAVAQRISLALGNLNLREVLRNQSIRDPLTGLFNRRYMEESLVRELHRAQRKKRNVALAMLDLDHFKVFNDTYGHQAGDMLMTQLGGIFKSRVRAGDIACRYGGEEFALILAESDAEGARLCVEKIREEVQQLHIHFRGQSLGSVTISAGIAAFPEHAGGTEDLIRAGDLALYQAKAAGRDCVVVCRPEEALAPATVSRKNNQRRS